MRIRRPDGSISRSFVGLVILGGAAAAAALLLGLPTVGPWILSIGAIAVVAWAIKNRGDPDGDAAGSSTFGASDSSGGDSGSSSC